MGGCETAHRSVTSRSSGVNIFAVIPLRGFNIYALYSLGSLTYTETYRSGDVCERRRWRKKRAKRSGRGRNFRATAQENFGYRNRA